MSTDAADINQQAARKKTRSRLFMHAFLIVFGIIMLYPLVWLAVSSLKPSSIIFSDTSIIPRHFEWENYARGWEGVAAPFKTFFWNSFVISILAVIGNVMSCSFVAYAFARLNFSFKKPLFALMLMTIMLPVHASLIPQYILFNAFGWINTILPIVTPKFLAVEAFFIFLMIQFIRGIPRELDEAAAIDGAGPIRIFFSIILPLMTPALVTTAVFSFLWTYEDFLTPLIYLTSIENYVVPQGLRLLQAARGSSSWGPMLAMSLLSLGPMFIVFFIFQRKLIDGIATTGLKG
ncbi:carbohydrate ABC transporter permease [Falsirhodobacter sp. alg1]|uniref:carbohydrate ABC transporter permease n=1 Tax=Falsirhodobacter sp. alg1 TaxID=1472418 RepID=UPI0007880824|nr:carbohydrate ABC transporter permease [Falsirhodobacter sp. alg1]